MFLPVQDSKTSLSTPNRGELAIMPLASSSHGSRGYGGKGPGIHSTNGINGIRSRSGGLVIAPGPGFGSETVAQLEWTRLKDGYALDIQDACARSSEGVLLVVRSSFSLNNANQALFFQ